MATISSPIRTLAEIPHLYYLAELEELNSILKSGRICPPHYRPGDLEWYSEAESLDDFVCLFFRANPRPSRLPQRVREVPGEFVWLKIDAAVMTFEDTRFSFDISRFSDTGSFTIDDAECYLDFEVLYDRADWREPSIQRRLCASERQAVLVRQSIPASLILDFR